MAIPDFGALVISLDFEIHWGVRDTRAPDSDYRMNLLGVRQAVPRLLDLFERYGIGVTWATVGFLFAQSRTEIRETSPRIRPAYANKSLYPYTEPLGTGEDEDPLHYAPSLIEKIRHCPAQEIGSHTYSHYYCLEPGQTVNAFAADLRSAVRIAHRRGITLESIAFPRNQCNSAYLTAVQAAGIRVYRGNENSWMHRPRTVHSPAVRAARLLDQYVPVSGAHLTRWSDVVQPGGLANVPASRFLRPYSPVLRHLDGLRMQRMEREMRQAAVSGRIYHLWWHPHNFGSWTFENLAFLEVILQRFARLRMRYGMRSMNMAQAARIVLPRETREVAAL